MKAYLLLKSGKADVLKIHEIPSPQIKSADEVLIKVKYIGVNYAEILSRKGQYSWAPPKPYVPGMECYGEVLEVGENVKHVNKGDAVIAGGQFGSYAEKKVVQKHLVFPALAQFSPEENAAFLVNFMTAWVVLNKQARLTRDETVLIHAAAGGVGTAAIQIAKALEAKVIGTAGSDEKIKLVQELGADTSINYLKDDFHSEIVNKYGGVDVVLEVVGGDVYRKSIDLLNPFGRMCIAGYASIPLNKWNPFTYWKTWKNAPKANIMNMAKGSYGIFATHIGYLTDDSEITQKLFDEIKEFVTEHQLKPIVSKVYKFEELPKAHAFIQARKSHGKIVVALD